MPATAVICLLVIKMSLRKVYAYVEDPTHVHIETKEKITR